MAWDGAKPPAGTVRNFTEPLWGEHLVYQMTFVVEVLLLTTTFVKQEPVKFEVTYRCKQYEGTFSVAAGRILVSVRLEEGLWSQGCACSNGNPFNTARHMAREILTRAGEAEEVHALDVRLRRGRSLAD
jgi:hypothetical protein